jgi:hypothetical protein
LAGNVEFQALGDVPRPLAPDRRGEWSLHDSIVSQARNPRTLTDHRLPPSSTEPAGGHAAGFGVWRSSGAFLA